MCPGHKFKTPENKQENCSFVKFMAISEMRTAVIDSLLYEDITSLSRTSQANLRFMEASFVSDYGVPHLAMPSLHVYRLIGT